MKNKSLALLILTGSLFFGLWGVSQKGVSRGLDDLSEEAEQAAQKSQENQDSAETKKDEENRPQEANEVQQEPLSKDWEKRILVGMSFGKVFNLKQKGMTTIASGNASFKIGYDFDLFGLEAGASSVFFKFIGTPGRLQDGDRDYTTIAQSYTAGHALELGISESWYFGWDIGASFVRINYRPDDGLGEGALTTSQAYALHNSVAILGLLDDKLLVGPEVGLDIGGLSDFFVGFKASLSL